jgi:hypothetical protein
MVLDAGGEDDRAEVRLATIKPPAIGITTIVPNTIIHLVGGERRARVRFFDMVILSYGANHPSSTDELS